MKKFSAIAQTFILTSFSFSALSLSAISPAQAASFIGLGNFIVHNPFYKPPDGDDNRNYYNSSANGVSADGSVVVGSIDGDWDWPPYTPPAGSIAGYSFRWTQADGMNIIATGNADTPLAELEGALLMVYQPTVLLLLARRLIEAIVQSLITILDFVGLQTLVK